MKSTRGTGSDVPVAPFRPVSHVLGQGAEVQPHATPVYAHLPLVDLHLHQERSARLNQVLAARGLEPLGDWPAWLVRLGTSNPPGIERLRALWDSAARPLRHETADITVARFSRLLGEAAAAGAVLAEVRVGHEAFLRSDFVELFREAESAVRSAYPAFRAGLVGTLKLWHEPREIERALLACVSSGPDGPGGVDFIYQPYDVEADWIFAQHLAERAASAGLGVTAHAGEFSASNIAAALRLPGLSRIGHAVHATDDPRLLDLLLESGVAVECCLTSNLVLGAVRSLAEHPIPRLQQAGVPVVLGTDDPLQFGTTIAKEYALAASLGLSADDLKAVSRTAVHWSFTSADIRTELSSLPELSWARQ